MFLIPKTNFIIKKTNHKGRGVFATKDIDAGTIIGDYLGVVMSTVKAVKTEPLGTYYMELTDSLSILAKKKDSGIHIINHSCAPNCGSENFKGHIVYFALRKIFKGEEISVNYNFGPPDKESCNPCMHNCHCNSKFCKGSMHTSSDKDSLITSEYSKHSKSFKIKMGKLKGKKLTALKLYPKIIEDDIFFDIYGYEKSFPTILYDEMIPSVKVLRKTIRTSGRTVAFPKIGLVVHGVIGDSFISTKFMKN